MKKSIKTVYVIHHSHMDVGFTDLQERIIDVQVDNIRNVLSIMEDTKYHDFRWTCETYFCIEHFLAEASQEEQDKFFAYAKEGRIGISASYLNFCDLVDNNILSERTSQMAELFKTKGINIKTAMTADVNGVSMGQRDALMDAGVEFLYTNINTHHGMYPMYQNQKAYWWQRANGKMLLVWNGEHYHLGNELGIRPYIYNEEKSETNIEILHKNLSKYITECEEADLQNDFIVLGVSGELSDNAPPNKVVLDTIKAYNSLYGEKTKLVMVTLQELYQELSQHLSLDELPVATGDYTDWWANGVGSTPLAVKHYRGAQRMYHLSARAVPQAHIDYPELKRTAEDNLLLYAEHTWGHCASIGNPYETFVSDLDIRKTSYASKAHEASALLLNRAIRHIGGDLKQFNIEGQIKAIYPGGHRAEIPVEFHVESPFLYDVRITDETGTMELKAQTSPHPRGSLICFVDSFNPGETKQYRYKCIRKEPAKTNSRYAYVGTEKVKDIINDYEPDHCHLPHKLENVWFRIEYEVGKGFTSLYDKENNRELIVPGMESFFTPIYEKTKIGAVPWEERSKLGRNIRGIHATRMQGILFNVEVVEKGCLYTQIKFSFKLDGAKDCFLHVKMYNDLPRIELKLGIAKHLSDDIESVYLPLSINRRNEIVYLKKGSQPFRPGVDQIPGTCMEYWMTDTGIVYFDEANQKALLIHTPDTPLIYMGELKHHPIKLCDGKLENNFRPVYSWVMNNTWETNFRMDLSGFGEYSYALQLIDAKTPVECFKKLEDSHFGALSCILR
ncbi:MAG: hypothetical protein FWC73_03540 [Defluviitaleaceae bacterium]|nr:hypothetical protein [Defluviitaleaceae bacterium]